MNATVVLIIVCAAVAVLGLAGAVWVVLREQRLRTQALQAEVTAAQVLAAARAEAERLRCERDELRDEAAQAQLELARARVQADAERAELDAQLVATVRGAIWPMGDALAPTNPGLAGLIEAGQRTLARAHAPAPEGAP